MADVEIPDPEELEERKGKAFTRRVALVTAIYAVALAITSLGGSNASKDMMLAQQQAADQWAFYQAKNIRGHEDYLARRRLELDLADRSAAMDPDARKRADALLAELVAEEEKYNKDKEEIMGRAKHFEEERDVSRRKDPYFDYAEVLLQIAIVIASIAILDSSARMFGFSLVLAVLGALLSLNGYTLLIS